MNALIVHAHPEPQSFCSAQMHTAQAALEAQGYTVTVSDLYAMGFDPVAKAGDFGHRQNPDYLVYALEQRHGWEDGSIAGDIRAEVDKLQAADLLILSFPVYWFSLPAILKGWIDRVLLSGVAYGGRRVYDRGGLAGKRAMLLTTLGSRPHMLADARSIHGHFDDMFRHIQQGTLGYIGCTVLPAFIGWHVPYIAAEDRAAILQRLEDYLRNLDSLTPLPMPKLADFDASLAPLPVSETPTG